MGFSYKYIILPNKIVLTNSKQGKKIIKKLVIN